MSNQTSVMEEETDKTCVGEFVGMCKWFSKSLGYGFITGKNGSLEGHDIFVHHSGINPCNSNFRTLRLGEYVQFNILSNDKGMQAVDVTGILGGPLLCDHNTYSPISTHPMPEKGVPLTSNGTDMECQNQPPIDIGDTGAAQ